MSAHISENQRRITLSAVELLASDYRFMAEDVASKPESAIFCSKIWKKSDAINKIEWFADCFKEKLNRYLNREEELRIKAKFDTISNKAISQLEESQLWSDLFNKIANIFKAIFDEVLFETKTCVLQPTFSLSEKDFQTAGMRNYQEYTRNKRVPVCYDFAFHQLNETKAVPHIFNSAQYQWPSELFKDTINFLANWDYNKVDEPITGDLVVYSQKGVSQHFGIWTQDGHVLSKFGINHVVKHPIDEVFLGYGDDINFFRKKLTSSISYFASLPKECIPPILKACSNETLLQCEAVCKVWQTILTKDNDFQIFKKNGPLLKLIERKIHKIGSEKDIQTVRNILSDTKFLQDPKAYMTNMTSAKSSKDKCEEGVDIAISYLQKKITQYEAKPVALKLPQESSEEANKDDGLQVKDYDFDLEVW